MHLAVAKPVQDTMDKMVKTTPVMVVVVVVEVEAGTE
jgi:hypothetical protein